MPLESTQSAQSARLRGANIPVCPDKRRQTGMFAPRSGESEAAVTVQMELKRIIINEIHDQQVIMLREVDGERSFPIVIGIFEATSIDRRVRGISSPRPLTHDLIAGVIDQLGGDFQDV